MRLEYQDDGSVTGAVKLQELFGLAATSEASGNARIPKYAKSFAAGIPSTHGLTIHGRGPISQEVGGRRQEIADNRLSPLSTGPSEKRPFEGLRVALSLVEGRGLAGGGG
jgi:hypothetical protein